MVQVNDTRIGDQLVVAQHVIFETVPNNQAVGSVIEEEGGFEVLFEPLHHGAVQIKVGIRCKSFGPSY